jgi:AmmeMemoRadiSam system protein B
MDRPRLRRTDRIELERGKDSLVVLRDPLGLCEPLAIDAAYAPILDLLDGKHTVAQVRQSLFMRGRLDVLEDEVQDLVEDLSEHGLLDDDAFRALWVRAHDAFAASEIRPPRLAGLLYPEDAPSLRRALAQAIPSGRDRFCHGSDLLGLVCPHAPAELAAPVLNATLFDLPPPDEIEHVIIVGTDHGPGLLPFAITSKRYRTPLGEVPAAVDLAAALERRVPWVRQEEVRHRGGPSIELAMVLLLYLYGESCPPVLPVLCGRTALASADLGPVELFIAALQALCDGRPVLLWTSAELAHAGPAYGHPQMHDADIDSVSARDRDCIHALLEGSPDRFVRRCLDEHEQGRPSGAAAMAVASQLLPVGYRTKLAAYELVPSPGAQQGRMGLVGLRFYPPAEDTT